MRVRFHLDENVPSSVAAALRRRSLDVTCTAEVGLTGATDQEQLNYASAERRVLVTQDKDFLRLHRLGVTHWGIVYWSQESVSIGALLRHLVLMHDLLEPAELRNKLEFP